VRQRRLKAMIMRLLDKESYGCTCVMTRVRVRLSFSCSFEGFSLAAVLIVKVWWFEFNPFSSSKCSSFMKFFMEKEDFLVV